MAISSEFRIGKFGDDDPEDAPHCNWTAEDIKTYNGQHEL